ncbi:MAG: YaaA family protein [Bacillota bacterium]
MKIILSPSKTQNHQRKSTKKGKSIIAEKMTQKLFNYLKSLSKKELAAELDIQGNLLDRTYELYQNHKFSDKTIPALECYNGAVFKQIELENFEKKEINYLQEKLVIISPMYGPLTAQTEIWPYRLEMKLKPNGIKLKEYWQEIMKDYFAKTDLIINLASNEYSKVVKDNYQGKIINFYFKEEKEDGSLKTVGYYVKQNRGKLLNKLIKNQVKSLKEIKELNVNGYQFEPKESDENNYKFIKAYK